MPSTVELILFLLTGVVFVVLVGLEERARGRRQADQTSVRDVESRIMRYSSAVYWFRDYWSHRPVPGKKKELKRNVQDEDFGIDTGSRTQGDRSIVVQESGNRRCSVQGPERRFTNLVDPYLLVRKFEPQGIIIRDVTGHSVLQLPGGWQEYLSGARAREIPWLNKFTPRLKAVAPEEVYAEPLIQAKGRPPLVILVIAVLVIWLTSIVLRYLTAFIPWLEPIYLPIMVLTSVLYMSLLAHHIITEATARVQEANATIYLYDGERPNERHYRYAGDIPGWLESKPYWVFRYLFTWPRELTVNGKVPFIHFPQDLERADVWVDAKTGTVEWIVSDYHWRELWYKAEPDLRAIRLWIFPNFHTPRPLNIEIGAEGELRDLYVHENSLEQAWRRHKLEHTILMHPEHWIALRTETSIFSPIVEPLSELWWDQWRYPLGADSDHYKNSQHAAVGQQPPLPDAGNVLGVAVKELDSDKQVYLVKCQDGNERACGLREKTRIFKDDAVSVSSHDSQSGDIIWKYTERESELLRRNCLLAVAK